MRGSVEPIRPGIRRWLRVGGRDAGEARRDVDEEIALHVALRAEHLMAEGWSREDAMEEARRRFAKDGTTVRRLYRAAGARNERMRFREWREGWRQDARHAARGLAGDPLLTIFVALTLALGIGANVTAFSFVDRLVVRGPAHVPAPEALVRLYARTGERAGREATTAWLPYPNYASLVAGMERSVTAMGAHRVMPTMIGTGREGRMHPVAATLGGYFDALGARPLLGRFFEADEDAASAGNLVVLSADLWRSRFGAAATALGRSIPINGDPHTVVGVAPDGFSGPEQRRVAAWTLARASDARFLNWHVIARLSSGSTLAEATAEVALVHRRTAEEGATWMREASMLAAPIRYGATARETTEATVARWMAGVSAAILLITLANVVNLLLVRQAKRRRELAIRMALGSGHFRVVRLLALEGILLALAGGTAALGVAGITEPIVRSALFAGEASFALSLTDVRLLGSAVLFVLASCVFVGVVPALLQTLDPRLMVMLRTGGKSDGTRARTRAGLTIVQAALSVVLLVTAGLFVRSLVNVRGVELGVDPERVIVATAALARPEGATGADGFERSLAAEREAYRRLAEAARALPGVEHASIALGLPLDGGAFSTGVWTEDADSISADGAGGAYLSAVGEDYFETVGTRVLRGRAFTAADREGGERVAIVNETMARRLWADREPLGACVRFGGPSAPCARVVGIVSDVRRTGLRDEPRLQIYMPFGQHAGFMGASLLVRPAQERVVQWEVLRQALLDADPSIHGVDLKPMTAALDGELQPLRIGLVTFGLAATLALLVAALGLYGLMASMVAWRTHEIGIRCALGATATEVTALVVRNGLVMASAGVAIGMVAAVATGRQLEGELFLVRSHDPLVLGVVAGALLGVALLAAWQPARRAARISPLVALRSE